MFAAASHGVLHRHGRACSIACLAAVSLTLPSATHARKFQARARSSVVAEECQLIELSVDLGCELRECATVGVGVHLAREKRETGLPFGVLIAREPRELDSFGRCRDRGLSVDGAERVAEVR